MILVDTSFWITLFRGGAARSLAAKELDQVHTCSPVLQELLQGLPDSQDGQIVKKQLLHLPRLSDPTPVSLYIEAAEIFRTGRRLGKTIRSSVDCLIAAIAIHHQIPVLHHDRDFTHIASFTGLKIYRQ